MSTKLWNEETFFFFFFKHTLREDAPILPGHMEQFNPHTLEETYVSSD